MPTYFSTAPIRIDEERLVVQRIRYDIETGTRYHKLVHRDIHRDICVEIPKKHAKCCRGVNGDAWMIPLRTRRVADNLLEVQMWDCAAGNGSHVHLCAIVEEKARFGYGPPDLTLRALPTNLHAN